MMMCFGWMIVGDVCRPVAPEACHKVNYVSMSAWTDRDAFDKWWGSKSFVLSLDSTGRHAATSMREFFPQPLFPTVLVQ